MIFAITIIILALVFDFLNGFHDAANAVATVVVSKTLKPLQAVLLAGVGNFIGYFIFGVAVATTVGKGIVDANAVTLPIIFSALMGAVIWNIVTWILGLPTSSSHALIGGLIGSVIVAGGVRAVILPGVVKTFLFIFIAPLVGMFGAMVFTILIIWIFKRSHRLSATRLFKYLQLVSATFYSIGHGTNDAQKTMGIIALVLFTAGISSTFHVDNWIILSCHAAIASGTLLGGWRIVRTMGTKVSKIRAMEGFCAETSAAVVLIGTAHFGIPVSTTHVIAGSIMGVGSVEHARSVRWVTARRILYSWLLTMPIAAIFAAVSYAVVHLFL